MSVTHDRGAEGPGGLVSIRPGNSLHFKADLCIWGRGCQMPVSCGWESIQGTPKGLGTEAAGVSTDADSGLGGGGCRPSPTMSYCSPLHPGWLQVAMEVTHTGAT